MTTRKIVVYNTDTFLDKLQAINKKAVKLGFPEIKYAWGDDIVYYDDITGKTVIRGKEVELTYQDEIKLPGKYRLVCVLDHTEKLIKNVPNQLDIPDNIESFKEFLDRGPVCDHCHINRYRTETFIVIDEEGEPYQVGRQCLGEFLGIDAARYLHQVDLIKMFDFDSEEFRGPRQPDAIKLDTFLAYTSAAIRQFGWTSRSKQDLGNPATADIVWDEFFLPSSLKDEDDKLVTTDADKELGEEVAMWMLELSERYDLNDYMTNLCQIGENNYVTHKSAGLAASAINAYMREIEQNRPKGGEHLGEVGKKIVLELTLIRSFGYQVSRYTWTYKHIFQDEYGNVVVWGTGNELDLNKFYTIKATVKEHSVYQGTPQTVITRGKVL